MNACEECSSCCDLHDLGGLRQHLFSRCAKCQPGPGRLENATRPPTTNASATLTVEHSRAAAACARLGDHYSYVVDSEGTTLACALPPLVDLPSQVATVVRAWHEDAMQTHGTGLLSVWTRHGEGDLVELAQTEVRQFWACVNQLVEFDEALQAAGFESWEVALYAIGGGVVLRAVTLTARRADGRAAEVRGVPIVSKKRAGVE